MNEYEYYINQAIKILTEQRYYESIGEVLYCDRWYALPVKGRPYMNQVSEFLTKNAQSHLTSNETKKVIVFFKGMKKEGYINDEHRGVVRCLTDLYEESVQIPIDLKLELMELNTKAQEVWQEAYHNSDFDMFKPYLKKQFELQKKIARAINPDKPVYDVLINRTDKGYTTKQIGEIFKQVKEFIVPNIQTILEKNKEVNEAILNLRLDKSIKKEISLRALEAIGFDKERGTIYEALHPVCSCVGPGDSRPALNFDNVWNAIASTIHECGHGMYNYNANEKATNYGLWGGVYGSVHESQSRFYENMIGGSKAFWEYFYPQVQELIPEMRQVPLDNFYKALINIKPGYKRITADEFTYSLHVIIRFEIERDYFAGEIDIDDFESVWNQKYEDYLGIRPQNARQGILQDVHWASGYIGYFQSYVLGDIYASQFRHQMIKDIPEVYQEIKRGNMNLVNKWLKNHVHCYGQTYLGSELLQKVTGESLNPTYYLNYLKEKYSIL